MFKREWFWGAVAGIVATAIFTGEVVRALGAGTPQSRFIAIETAQASDHAEIGKTKDEVADIKTMFARIEQELKDLKESLQKK